MNKMKRLEFILRQNNILAKKIKINGIMHFYMKNGEKHIFVDFRDVEKENVEGINKIAENVLSIYKNNI